MTGIWSARPVLRRLASSRFDKSTRPSQQGLAHWLSERMQLGFRGLAPSFCL
jgi:hypothetical protein